MFTAERNELLTRVGGGTPMGELFRRYWLPAAQRARAVSMVVPREMSLPDAVAMAQKDPAKTVSA
jgi:phthalate 4,5-dioxygenase oxygenase subunit